MGDFNGDGKADIAVVNQGGGPLGILFGNGDGTFRGIVNFASGFSAFGAAIAAGDFNGDGKTDFAAVLAGDRAVGVLLGQFLAPATTSITPSRNPSVSGQNLTLSAVVSPATATGSVAFYDGPSYLGTTPLVNGQAAFSTSILAAGTHSLTAVYGGDANNVPSFSAVVTESVLPAAASSAVTLTSSANPSPYGQNLTLRASVQPGSATGLVTFYDGANIVGSAPVNSGQAALTTNLLLSRPRSLTASYSGDSNYAPSTSKALALLVRSLPANGLHASLTFTSADAQSVVTGDFNGDGKADFAVADGSVKVYLGRGDGSFQSPITFSAGVNAEFVATGDFNRDGKTDLVVISQHDGFINVLLGNGDGTFRPTVSYADLGPSSVVVGDFNGDGKADLLAVNGYSLSILLGNGDGTFQAATTFGSDLFPSVAAIGDFNGDGKADLVTATFSEPQSPERGVYVLLGNGDGTFLPPIRYASGTDTAFVTVADFNGDGKADFAVANYSGNFVSVYIGKGDGTFQPPATYVAGGGTSYMTVADFNGDGSLDLIQENNNWGITILNGNGDGTFGSPQFIPGSNQLFANSLAVADFNGDGRPDLVLAAGPKVTIALGVYSTTAPTTTTLTSSLNPAIYSHSVLLTATVLAANGNPTGSVTFYDGATVLATRQLLSGQVSFTTNQLPSGQHSLTASYSGSTVYSPSVSQVLQQTVRPVASAGFQPVVNYATGAGTTSIAPGDFNRDGKVDLAVINATSHTFTILLGNGDGTFQSAAIYDTGRAANRVVVGDFNGDGIQDLAISFAEDGNLAILLGNGNGTFMAPVNYAVFGNSYSLDIAVGDFNGDSKADLVTANYDGSVSVLLGNGDGIFQTALNFSSAGTHPISVTVGDFNGDGKADVAVANSSSNNLGVLLGNGDGTFRPAILYGTGASPFSVVAGDFNADGKLDLATANQQDNNVSVLFGRGDGTFQPLRNYPAGPLPVAIAAADLNGDLKLDVAVADFTGSVSVLYGNGNGTFQSAVAYGPGLGAGALAIADLNGDGAPDMAFANNGVSVLLGIRVPGPATEVGVFRSGAAFLLDRNGNRTYDAGVDLYISTFMGLNQSQPGDLPVTGDWTGDGVTKIGVYRPSTGQWFLDANNNGVFDGGDYTYSYGGLPGDLPFTGDWAGRGKSCIGIYRSNGSVWLLDLNCNGVFDNTPTDAFFPFGGLPGDLPVVGAWTGDTTRVGVVRKYAPAGIPQGNPFFWVLDNNAATAGNTPANHPAAPNAFAFGGLPGDLFLSGDWYGTDVSYAAVYRAGIWVLDVAPPGAPLPSHAAGAAFGYGGIASDLPVAGKW